MKKHPLIRAIQYLEKHYGSINTYARHDTIYLSTINNISLSRHRLKRLQHLNLFIEKDVDSIDDEVVKDIEFFIYYT